MPRSPLHRFLSRPRSKQTGDEIDAAANAPASEKQATDDIQRAQEPAHTQWRRQEAMVGPYHQQTPHTAGQDAAEESRGSDDVYRIATQPHDGDAGDSTVADYPRPQLRQGHGADIRRHRAQTLVSRSYVKLVGADDRPEECGEHTELIEIQQIWVHPCQELGLHRQQLQAGRHDLLRVQ